MVIPYSTPIPSKENLLPRSERISAHPTENCVKYLFLQWVVTSGYRFVAEEAELPGKPSNAAYWPRPDIFCASLLTDSWLIVECKGSFNAWKGDPRKNSGIVYGKTCKAVAQIEKYRKICAKYAPNHPVRYVLALPAGELFDQDRAYITDYGIGIYEFEMPDWFVLPPLGRIEYDRDLQPSRKGRS